MFVGESFSFEFLFVILLVFLCENIQKEAIVVLKNSVLGGELQGVVPVYRVVEASPSKRPDRVVHVEHSEDTAWSFEVMNQLSCWSRVIIRGENNFSLTCFRE